MTGFEPAISWPPSKRDTKFRYIPILKLSLDSILYTLAEDFSTVFLKQEHLFGAPVIVFHKSAVGQDALAQFLPFKTWCGCLSFPTAYRVWKALSPTVSPVFSAYRVWGYLPWSYTIPASASVAFSARISLSFSAIFSL